MEIKFPVHLLDAVAIVPFQSSLISHLEKVDRYSLNFAIYKSKPLFGNNLNRKLMGFTEFMVLINRKGM